VRTASPRTAAQLAAAGMGVAIVPASALTPRPEATVRPFDPPALRDVVVVVAAPHDALVRRFVADLKERGLPLPCISPLADAPAISASPAVSDAPALSATPAVSAI
jgi:LysR substrate binding domain